MDILTIILGITLVCLVAGYLYLCRNRGYLESTGLPLVKPFLCFGSPPYWFSKTYFHEWYMQQFQKFGRTWARYDGVGPTIVTIDPELVKEITVKQFDNFTDIIPMDFKPEETTLDVAKGDTWRALRKLLSPTFSTGKLKTMVDPIDGIADSLIEELKSKTKENPEIDMKPIIQGFTMDAICKIAFGLQTNCHKGQDKDIFKLALDHMAGLQPSTVVHDFFFQLFFHLPEIMPSAFWSEPAQKMAKLSKDVMNLRDEQNTASVGDFIDRLRDMKKENHPLVPNSMVDAQGMIFMVAGFETTANTLGSMMYYFATHEDEQNKVYEEIIDTIGDGEITHDTIKDLEYLEAFIMETLRIAPPILAHFRCCTKDCEIKGIPFKKGTTVQLAILPAHMDHEFFPEPQIFKPERFLKENSDKIIPYTWRPFGSGNRNCIGQRFSLTEIKLCAAKLIREFQIYKTPKTKLTHSKGSWFLYGYPEIFVGLKSRN